jgi:monofunctional biosynthetic peptidoglycan transglycosylase
MVLRVFEGWFDGKSVGIDKSWRSFDEISPNIYRAVVSGEDARFMQHEGFDWKAIENARKYNEAHQGKRLHGASTISMQTAKNTFLWHGRNYVRKGLEAYFTFLIEKIWGKKRILEVYVNIVEWGDGVYGVEAASEKYFNKEASQLSKREAALLASVLPNPRRWAPNEPTRYINRRAGFIQGRMNSVAIPKD